MAMTAPASQTRRSFATDLAQRLAAGLDAAAGTHLRACLLLVVVALIAFLPGIGAISPIDRDEARFAQASKQMLETGNFVDIRFKEDVRYKKPVGIHWLQAASAAMGEALTGPSARTNILFYRLPSLIGAIGAVLLTYWTALVFTSRRGALLAGLMMASCVLLGIEARLAKTDAVLLCTVMASMGALARAYLAPVMDKRGSFPNAAIFWTGLAIGILIKGPMAPLFVGLPILALVIVERSGRFLLRLRPLPGILWCLLLVLPWFVAIYYVTNGQFYKLAVGVDMLGKVTEGQEGHWAPPGTYLLAIWGTFWPAIVLAVMALPFAWRARREKPVVFLIAWVVPAWLVFEITATKLPHYVLPLYPALAILTGLAWQRGELQHVGKRLAGLVWLWPLLGVLLAGALAFGFYYLGDGAALMAWPFLAVALVLLVVAALALPSAGAQPAYLVAVVGALALHIGVYQGLMPHLKGVWISQRLATIARDSGCPANRIATVPYQEPSLAFLAGTDIRFTDPVQAADLLNEGGCSLAFIGKNMLPLFELRMTQLGLKPQLVERVAGFAYNGGRMVEISVFRAEPTR
ncbi:glycosyl transferase [Azorhizobium oxalatiphilum]|uniref:Glycosyl transferase n=1 Tax=Azorhizobium oxalatiphilum TaxID=980631 RepID=A0A917FGM2_9HYPH|nr:glycosyltransferase family 39 protein [Azorhizobium oxalatiphilum]GGF74104.1 glycosyl transferase [Azorhizobium oxalatiphilum]